MCTLQAAISSLVDGFTSDNCDFMLACARSLKTLYTNTHGPIQLMLQNKRAIPAIVALVGRSGACAEVGANLITR